MKKQKNKQFKQIENQAQDGRSMVEMLGVLAIIGVLSIGGIAGYRWGMDKHVSNQILYEMNLNSAQLAMLLQKGNPEGVTLSLGSPYDEGKFRTVDYGFAYGCGEEASFGHDCKFIDETMYSMTATGLPKRVCNMLGDAVFGMPYYYDSEINGGDNECNDTGNTVTVFFDTDTTVEGGIPRPEESETRTPVPEVTEPTTTTPETTTPETTVNPCGPYGRWIQELCGCLCDNGWGGRDCSQSARDACNGHGEWKNDYGGVCLCDFGWSGSDCSTCTNDDICKCSGNGWWCGSHCECYCGWWFGEDCSQTEEEACEHSGHGSWCGYYCECEGREMGSSIGGYAGPDCSKTVDEYCHGHAYCGWDSYNQKCMCDPGWCGQDCSTCSESGQKCSCHGYWNGSICYCTEVGWGGEDCSQPGYCSGHGLWNNYWNDCSCESGYCGTNCENSANPS